MEHKTKHRIILKDVTQMQSRSIPVLPNAFIESSLLSIDLLSIATSVTAIIKDAETDEIVFSCTSLDVDELLIDLAGEYAGKYLVEIHLDENIFCGTFFIE